MTLKFVSALRSPSTLTAVSRMQDMSGVQVTVKTRPRTTTSLPRNQHFLSQQSGLPGIHPYYHQRPS